MLRRFGSFELLCIPAVFWQILSYSSTDAYSKYRCKFPEFLNVPDGWGVRYSDGDYKASITRGQLDAKSCVKQCQEYVRYCQEEKENGKFVVSQVCKKDKMCPLPYTKKMQVEIVNMHNKFRRNVKPAATNMEKMYWDATMAKMALKHSTKCVFEHNTAMERSFEGYINVGQNLFASTAKPNAVTPAMAWHNEVRHFTFGRSTTAVVGHCTQVVQGRAARIGCGGAYCPNNRLKYIVTCHYLRGQYNYKTPYNNGTTCNACPHKCDRNLCDCQGKVCQYGGKLMLNTCKCACKGLTTGNTCSKFKCHLKDMWYCKCYQHKCASGAGFAIQTICPHMCGQCKSSQS